MVMLIIGTALALTLTTVLIPIQKERAIQAKRAYDEAFRAVKLRAIRRYYPMVSSLSDQELLTSYDVEQAYNDIGRR